MDAAGIRERLERLLADAERVTGLRVTVHDRTDAFSGLLESDRYAHQHPFCRAGRGDDPSTDQRCQAHCRYAMNARAADPATDPFVHACWKGGSEACAPVHREGVHRLTLFGGALRAGTEPPPGVGPEARRAWRQLPPPDPARLAAAAGVLVAVGHGMLAVLDLAAADGGTRRAVIDRLVEANLERGLAPAELGRHLGLSPSRAAHAVAEIYGEPLGELMRQRRLARARRLLLSTDLPAGEVARRCGFASQHWFNRLFARALGEPPARWRRRQRAGA